MMFLDCIVAELIKSSVNKLLHYKLVKYEIQTFDKAYIDALEN